MKHQSLSSSRYLTIVILALSILSCKPKTSEVPADASSGDGVAQKMFAALGFDKLSPNTLLGWTVDGKQYIWDHTNNIGTVKIDSTIVMMSLSDGRGVAFKDGKRLLTDDQTFALSAAWSSWKNNYAWVLGPYDVIKPGMNKTLLPDSSYAHALHIAYPSNSMLAGNTATWYLGEDYVPQAASILTALMPNGAMDFTWENYLTLPSGLKIAQSHKFSAYDKQVTDIKEGTSLSDFGIDNEVKSTYESVYNR